MKKERKNKGITLIALIITIIVMLILVGVTVNVALNGGLFDTAKQATERTETAMIQEELSVIEATMNADILANPEKYTVINDEAGGAVMATTILQELQKYFVVDEKYITEDGNALDLAKIEQDGLASFNSNEMKMRIALPCKYKDYEGKVIVIALPGENIKIDRFELKFKFPVYFDKSLLTAEDLAIYESLSAEDKKTYEGIWLGAYAFTDDIEFAGMLATNDFDATTLISTFFFNGYSYTNFEGKNLAALMYRPDGSVVEILNDPNPLTYYMDSEYNMYEFNSETNVLKDENGKILTTEGLENNSDIFQETEYNGYKYVKRFDDKNVLITAVPEEEVLDMKTDLAGLDVYSMQPGIFKNTTTKRVILPDTIETLLWLSLGRADSSGANGMFEDVTSLEYVELSNNIKVLYTHTFENCTNLKEVIMPDNITTIEDGAFTGCDGVTLKFKDVNNIPEGQPWGGTNLNIVSK